MKIILKCFATLAPHLPENSDDFPIEQNETVASVARRIGIDPDEINLIFVNSARAYLETKLQDGDRLGLFPAVGGG